MSKINLHKFYMASSLATLAAALALPAVAQEEIEIDEQLVTGSQIRGASISGALAVSVIDAETIDNMGIDSGDELMALIPENGQNFFNEAENISGGVNSARGDVGAFNLRSLGTGNTLSLINGRRVVNSASFQTEEVGGSFVPVNTANTNGIPLRGVERVEVLRDGASAIYGADAVAGVVNTVLRTDYEGLQIRFRQTEYDNLPASNSSLSVQWGDYFNDGRTNVSVFADYFSRDRVNSQDDPKWADSDFRRLIPAGSPWDGDTAFRNNSANGILGPQFDIVDSLPSSHSLRTNDIVDNRGEFELRPLGDPDCTWVVNQYSCADEDGIGTLRYNLNENRDLRSDLQRYNIFTYINHQFDSGLESFTELGLYKSETETFRHPTASFSSSELVLAADNYYNPFGPCGSPNRLTGAFMADVPCTGLAMTLDNYRFAEFPRIVENDGETYRLLQGFRGQTGDWDWEGAVSWSRSAKSDVTYNRVSNTLMQEALNDTTAAAYNPFSGGVDSNIERAQISVYRESEAELAMWDLKFSNNELFVWDNRSVGFVGGVEWRRESFDDDRDPRLDGTIRFTDAEGDTFPFVSDVVNSSPTADNSGSRTVRSIFGELQLPLTDTLDVQLALRHENFSDIDSATVGKIAAGWQVHDQVLLRGSFSQAYRAPNLITINEDIIARAATVDDSVCIYAAENGGDPNQNVLDCEVGAQRTAQGSSSLESEESDNMSIGIVVDPLPGLSVTVDYWSIEKTNTIGLFGEENHTSLELLNSLNAGTANCGAVFNSAVERDDVANLDPAEAAIYTAAGICPAGELLRINDQYANLDTRTVEGIDLGVYYEVDTDYGRFNLSYNASMLEKFEQSPGGNAKLLFDASQAGTLPPSIPVRGFDDLIGRDGNQDYRHNMRATWRMDEFGAGFGWSRIGEFYQSSLTLNTGEQYVIPEMDTFDLNFDWYTNFGDTDTRFRLGIKNVTDERAPLADGYFGFLSDAHTDYGRYMYLDIRADFN